MEHKPHCCTCGEHMKLFRAKYGCWFYWCPLGKYHGRCCIWVDEYYLEDVSQDHHRSCVWADGVDEYDSEEALQDHHRSCICAEEGVDKYNSEDRVDEYNPEELRQRAQVGWQAKATDRAADWLILVGHCGLWHCHGAVAVLY